MRWTGHVTQMKEKRKGIDYWWENQKGRGYKED
jgi:hypothetical protein